MQTATLDIWARKFGVRILEGYGATECSPMISLNTRMEPGVGSAGRLVPGLEHRLETVEGVEEGGRLFVRGPNVMKGYLNPEANEKFRALHGWYDTGDIVQMDADGYLHIRGRMKRFAKVSGEMVSLTAVEDALAGAFPQFGLRCAVAVIAQPDEDKGEKLIAVTNEPKLQLAEVRAAIRAKGLSNLCAPRESGCPEHPQAWHRKTNHRDWRNSSPSKEETYHEPHPALGHRNLAPPVRRHPATSSHLSRPHREVSFVLNLANDDDREEIFRLRHDIYARELGQHATNHTGALRDKLDETNLYLTVRCGRRDRRLSSASPRRARRRFRSTSISPGPLWPFTFDDRLYEVRLLTVLQPHRGRELATLLMYAPTAGLRRMGHPDRRHWPTRGDGPLPARRTATGPASRPNPVLSPLIWF